MSLTNKLANFVHRNVSRPRHEPWLRLVRWLVSYQVSTNTGLRNGLIGTPVASDAMGRGQPGCQEEWKMCRKKRKIVMPMWCIYMCAHMLCRVVVMFTCTLVRSHPDSRRHKVWNPTHCNKHQDTGLGVATRCMLIGRGQNGSQFELGTRPWRTYSRGASRKWLFKYVQ